MTYLTTQHTQPPRHIEQNGQLIPTRPLIARDDSARLATFGIYPHITAPGSAPLGYTDWQFDGTQYTREPAGTQAERDAAEHEQMLDTLQCRRLQARLELLAQGLWEQVMTWAVNEGGETQAYFEGAQTWQFRDASFQAGVVALGLTEEQTIQMMQSAQQR